MMHLCFLLGVLFLLIRPQEFVPALQGAPLIQISLAAGLLAWLPYKDRATGLDIAKWALAFIVSACISSGTNGYWGGGRDVITRILPSVGFFLLAAGATGTKVEFRRFLWLVALSCVVLVYHGWEQVTRGVGFTGVEPLEGRIRYLGTLNDPNDLGILFCMGLIGVAYLYATSVGRIVRWAAALIGAAILYGVFLTQSRGTMLAVLAAGAWVGVRRYGKVKVGIIAGIVLPILWGATRLATISGDDESAEGRVDAWYEGFMMLRERPLFGVGVGGFADHNALTAHNSLVLVMAEGGLIGYTLWFIFFARSAWLGVQAAQLGRVDNVDDNVTMARTVVIMSLSVAVASMFLSRSYNPLLFIVSGLAVARSTADLRGREQLPDSGSNAPTAQNIDTWRLVKWAWLSVPAMFLVTKILLRF